MAKHSVKEAQHEVGETGVFGEIFVGLGLLILLGGIVLAVLSSMGLFDDSPVGAVAAKNDAFTLWFLLAIEGIGFTVFGVMILVSGWDRHHHPDEVH
jgi:Mn2+/Fe2+ NRAMP family transporter